MATGRRRPGGYDRVPLRQLIGDLVVFGQELAGNVEGDRVQPVYCNLAGKGACNQIERLVPAGAAAMDFRMEQSAFEADGPEIRWMTGIAAHSDRSIRSNFCDDTTTHSATGAGRAEPMLSD